MDVYILVFSACVVGIMSQELGVKEYAKCPPEESKYNTLLKVSIQECEKQCKIRPMCQAVGYIRRYNMCQLHSKAALGADQINNTECILINMEAEINSTDGVFCRDRHEFMNESSSCTIEVCQQFGEHSMYDILGHMTTVGSKRRFVVNATYSLETVCLNNGFWTRQQATNVAVDKQTEQSSVYVNSLGSYAPKFGVDGNMNQSCNIQFHSCFRTQPELYPWWQVDLVEEYAIVRCVLYNVVDIPHENSRNNGIEIRLGRSLDDMPCVDYVPGSLPHIYTKTFKDPILTRYVRITIKSSSENPDYLNLSEIEVFGYLGKENVALGKPAELSSKQNYMYEASAGTDGKKTYADSATAIIDFCFHSEKEENPWWRVDLLDLYYIFEYMLYNRITKPTNDSAHDIEVKFGLTKNDMTRVDHIPGVLPDIYHNSFDIALLARFVSFSIMSAHNELDIIHLCEVELYGVKA